MEFLKCRDDRWKGPEKRHKTNVVATTAKHPTSRSQISRYGWIILVLSATRLKMSLTSSPGRTKKFEFFHWLTKNWCAAEINYKALRIPFHFRTGWQQVRWRALRKKEPKQMATIADRSEGIVKVSRNQSSTSPATMSFSTVIIVFCCSSREETFKTLRIQPADTTITLSLVIPQEVIKLSSNRQWASRNICLASRKAQEESLSLKRSERNTTLAKQMWLGKSKGHRRCVFFSSVQNDQADQILAVQNLLILYCQNEQMVIRGVQSYITT